MIKKLINSIFYNLYILRFLGKTYKGVHLGCGNLRIENFLNIDANIHSNCDVISGINKIKLSRDSVGCIYASHVFEHIPRHRAQNVLFKWQKVLKSGGKLYLCVPDIESLARIYLSNLENFDIEERKNKVNLAAGIIFGGQSNKYDFHYFGYSFPVIKEMLENAGFRNVQRFNPDTLKFKKFNDASGAKIGELSVSLNVEAIK